ncbi:hypothetical protein F4553_001100 [Allocatelliglobosispora scoriae]|uniref:Uncharacterized protein n=1 Tax=Allocatelliglobosispora scoriae TaxID=643052 RepID=A0A841BLI0_9ACTN|nr:hypothetical protein [Allocatelliglobosispora scoriae]MBB5867721.1 hypothetical protein [Allocatelliglobosispora scoriae]
MGYVDRFAGRPAAFLAVLAGLLGALVLPPAAAHAGVTSGYAYLWANQPTTASYDPSTYYSFNSTGAVNHVVRLAVGRYEVQLPNLGAAGGVAHATAYGNTGNTCQIGFWTRSGDTLLMHVNCFAGSAYADTVFTAAFVNRPTAADFTYLFADQPTAASYTPTSSYQFNSSGASNTIQRLGTGYYMVNVNGVRGIGDVQITGYGANLARCSVGSFASLGYPRFGGVAFVHCVDAASAPVDANFTLTTSVLTGFLGRVPAAYARVDPPAPLTRTTPYTPTTLFNSTGSGVTATRTGVGRTVVAMPGQPLIGGTVHVTAYSFGTERCGVAAWGSIGVTVQCWQGSVAYDSPFTVVFQA